MNKRIRALLKRSDLLWAILIAILGLVLRWVHAREFSAHPYGRFTWIDEESYWRWALRIREGTWLPERPFYQDPLFAYVLAGVMSIVGPDVSAVRTALACLGALTPLAVFWAARVGLGRAEAVIGALIVALYRPLIFNDAVLEKEGIGALVAALALGLTARAADPSRRWRAFGLAGLAWGILALLRANALLLGAFGVFWCLGAFAGPWTGSMKRSAAFCAGFALALAPAALVNAVVSDDRELLLTTWQAGANFYIGNGAEANGTYVALPFVIDHPSFEADGFLAEAQRRVGHRLSPGQVSQYWLIQGLKHWLDAPGESLTLLGWKIALITNDFELYDNQSEELSRLAVAPSLVWGFLTFGWVFPLAAIGLARTERTPFWWFLVLSTVIGFFSTAAFFVVGRYRIPWIPGTAMLAAVGIVDTARRVGRKQWALIALTVLCLAVPAAVLAWIPTAVNTSPDRWAHFYFKMFTAYEAVGQLDDSIDAIDDGRALDPKLAPYFEFQMSTISIDQRQRIAAQIGALVKEEATRGRNTRPLRVARWIRLLSEKRGDCRSVLNEALKAHPDDPALHRELGAWWLGELRDPTARTHAIEEFDRASRGPSGDGSAAISLALMTHDAKVLDRPAIRSMNPRSTRMRMARAAIAVQPR